MSQQSAKTDSDRLPGNYLPLLFLFTLVCLSAFQWVPRAGQIGGFNTFLVADSVFCLGLMLLAGLLSSFFLPEQVLILLEKSKRFVTRHFPIFAAGFLATLLVLLIFINRNILHSFMNSADEHSCYFLAECLRRGKLWIPPHPAPEFFNVVHIGNRDGKWFSVYPPGWPLLYALSLPIGLADWINPTLSVLALIFFYQTAKILFGRGTAWLGTLFTGLSAFYLFTGASYFSHSTCLFAVSLFFFAVTKLDRSQDPKQRRLCALVAGIAVGYGIITRYLTTAGILAPFVMAAGIRMAQKKERWTSAKTFFVFPLVFFVMLLLIQNQIVTGRFWEAPNHYDKHWERLGFRSDYTPLHGLIYFVTRFFFLSDWAPPVLIFLYFCFLHSQKLDRLTAFFKISFLSVAAAYVFYYAWGGNQYGPRYFYEGYPFLVYTVMDGAAQQYRKGHEPLKKFLAGLLIFSIVTGIYQMVKQSKIHEVISRERKELYAVSERMLTKPSIVFIHGFLGDKLVMAEEDAVRNSPWLDAKIVYAHDLGTKNQTLRQYFPDREFYLGTYDRKAKKAVLTRLNI